MPKWNQLSISPGQEYGRLKIVRPLEKRNKHGQVVWLCECSCKKSTKAATGELKSGHKKSCGCLNQELRIGNTRSRKEPGKNGLTNLWYKYISQARSRGYEFSLTKEEFKILTQQNCYYCGCPPNNKITIKGKYYTEEGIKHSSYVYSGIDRKDNNVGYIKNNCVACCAIHNRMKMNLDESIFKKEVKKLYNHMFGDK